MMQNKAWRTVSLRNIYQRVYGVELEMMTAELVLPTPPTLQI